MKGRSALVLVAAVAILGTLSACGGSGSGNEADGAPSTSSRDSSEPEGAAAAGEGAEIGTYEVGRTGRTYVDTGRTTTANGDRPELSSRTLETVVLYPAAAAGPDSDALTGPWPTIVFSHGSTRAGIDYVETLEAWASAGYVVVAPNYPSSTTGAPGGTVYTDIENQTGDVSFVIDSVLADDAAPLDLADLVDRERIGLGGQSFGAITTLAVVASACCADDRVVAATEFAGFWFPVSTGDQIHPRAAAVPLLFVHGDDDPTVGYDQGRAAFELIGGPHNRFLTLHGSGHDDGYFGGTSTPVDRLVTEATLAFYDQHLKGDASARARLEDLVEAEGDQVATLTAPER